MKPTAVESHSQRLLIPNLRDGMEPTDYWRDLTERARSIEEPGEMDPRLALGFWANWLVERVRHHFDAVVLITGDEGTGKSTLALRMLLECARLQKMNWSPTEVCYSALDIVQAYRRVTEAKVKGWPVWYDEGVRGTMAGEQMLPEQRALVKALALVRESGAILFALYPSIWLAAKQIRARRACLWIHVVHRGLGRVHERDRRLNYMPTDALGLAISPRAPHVAWDAFSTSASVWKVYLATKDAKLKEFLTETENDLKLRGTSKTSEATATRKREAGRLRVAAWRRRHPKGDSGPTPKDDEPPHDPSV